MNMTSIRPYVLPLVTGIVVSFCWVWLFGFWAGNVDFHLVTFLFNTFGITSLVLISNILFSAFAAILFVLPVFLSCKANPLKGTAIFLGAFAVSFVAIQYMSDPGSGVASNIFFLFSLSPFSPVLMFAAFMGFLIFLLSKVSRGRKVYA